ncbi:hypothetical protein [Azotosporobacter soli]|uniref:hypothetical protein n=1 Tax=Azotosporobacter soli TaxID=3055040 RepID=UPI0031FEF5B6
MIIRAVTVLALHCARCGKIHFHDLSRFRLAQETGRELLCACGAQQGTLISGGPRQCLINIPCVVCQKEHVICLDGRQMWRNGTEKLYCLENNVELGFVGEREVIAAMVADYKREFERLVSDYDDYVENPEVMFEVLNCVHDIAEAGQILCNCGGEEIGAELLPDCIQLYCERCGGQVIISAKEDRDMKYVRSLERIDLMSPRRSRRNR